MFMFFVLLCRITGLKVQHFLCQADSRLCVPFWSQDPLYIETVAHYGNHVALGFGLLQF